MPRRTYNSQGSTERVRRHRENKKLDQMAESINRFRELQLEMGRSSIYGSAMTTAERVARFRAKRKAEQEAADRLKQQRNESVRAREERNMLEELARERHERILNRAYSICRDLAAEGLPREVVEIIKPEPCGNPHASTREIVVTRVSHPAWYRDWPSDRPDRWLPPPALLEDILATWCAPMRDMCEPLGYRKIARELMGPYDPEQGWPWRKASGVQ